MAAGEPCRGHGVENIPGLAGCRCGIVWRPGCRPGGLVERRSPDILNGLGDAVKVSRPKPGEVGAVPKLDVAIEPVREGEGICVAAAAASLVVTSDPSTSFGIQSWMDALSTRGSLRPTTTKLTMTLYCVYDSYGLKPVMACWNLRT